MFLGEHQLILIFRFSDYMDRFAEEQEMMLSSSSTSSYPTSNAVGSSSSPTPRPIQPHVQHSMFPSSYNSIPGTMRNFQPPDLLNNRTPNVVTSTVTSTSVVDFSTNSSYTNGHSRNPQGYPTITAAKSVNFPLIDSSTVRRTLDATEVRNVGSTSSSTPQSTTSPGQSPNLNLTGDTINCK